MAAPMTPAAPTRDQQVTAKENAIKRRLAKQNDKNKAKATSQVAEQLKKRKAHHKGGTIARPYATQYIKGSKEGFSDSDYGVDKGAAIPYQIGNSHSAVVKDVNPKKMPIPPQAGKNGKVRKWGDNALEKARVGAIVRRASKNPRGL